MKPTTRATNSSYWERDAIFDRYLPAGLAPDAAAAMPRRRCRPARQSSRRDSPQLRDLHVVACRPASRSHAVRRVLCGSPKGAAPNVSKFGGMNSPAIGPRPTDIFWPNYSSNRSCDATTLGFRLRRPGLAGARFDVGAHQTAHDLRRRRVLFGTKTLEDGFLARIDQDGEARGAFFQSQGNSLAEVGANDIIILFTFERHPVTLGSIHRHMAHSGIGSFSPLVACISLLMAWGAIGVYGLLRPASLALVRRVLFPLGALVGRGPRRGGDRQHRGTRRATGAAHRAARTSRSICAATR